MSSSIARHTRSLAGTSFTRIGAHARAARTILGVSTALALVGCDSDRVTSDAVNAGAASSTQRAVVSLVDSIGRAAGLPGVVVMVTPSGRNGYTATYGARSLERGGSLSARTHFRIGSITKPMVATVVLQLVDEGRLQLDDAIARYLPGVVPGADRITVRQLLDHTSGIPSYTDNPALYDSLFANPGRSWAPNELIALALALPPLEVPWYYSNTNYTVLGLLVEKVTGQALGAQLQRRIFDRLRMRDTYYPTTAALRAPAASGYLDLEGSPNVDVGTVLNPSWGGAGGAVVSTAADVTRFIDALATGSLVSARMRAAQQQIAPGSTFTIPGDPEATSYGLGAILSGRWIGHDGAIPGYESEAFSQPGVGTVVVLVNKSTGTAVTHQLTNAVRQLQFGTTAVAVVR